MKIKTLVASVSIALLMFSSLVCADIYVRPAKLGIIRLTVQPLFPTVYQGVFDVGDTYNFPLNVALSPSADISSIVTLSESNFTLQPNETRTVSFTIKPTDPGVYKGSVAITFSAGTNSTGITYEDEVTIVVTQSNSYILVLIALAVVAVLVVTSIVVMKKVKVVRK